MGTSDQVEGPRSEGVWFIMDSWMPGKQSGFFYPYVTGGLRWSRASFYFFFSFDEAAILTE